MSETKPATEESTDTEAQAGPKTAEAQGTHKRKDKRRKKLARGKDAGETAKLREELAASADRLLRLQADFENFRKRALRDKSEVYRSANRDLMEEMLPVLDHLDLALQHVEEHNRSDGFVEGIKLVASQLMTVLGKFGLSAIDAEGDEFDPNLHEAVSHLPSRDIPENRIMNQTRRGYLLGRQLLRAAQVVVSSGAPTGEPDANTPGESEGQPE